MKKTPSRRCSFAVAIAMAVAPASALAQLATSEPQPTLTVDVPPNEPVMDGNVVDRDVVDRDEAESEPPTFRFAFSGTAWREVIQWLADQSELALHVGDLPAGTFTYNDPSEFSPQEAIDRVNMFLLAEGFTLVRSGQLLSVINLGDPRSVAQLDVLARLITVDELDSANAHDVVKCLFPLGEIDADEAVQELSALKLMSTPTILSRTNQLLITDTVAKLRNVRGVLSAFQDDGMENGTVVKGFPLKHVSAEDVLMVARPHLGLATGEMIGIDVSLSADIMGKHIFVTGVEDKVELIENLIASIDQPEVSEESEAGEMVLKSHLVAGGNVRTVYDVLQTLLSGKTVRLSIDSASSSVVALATPAVQQEISDTVAQLQASDADFEVIPLKTVDPFFAIGLLEEMLDLPGPFDDPDDIDPDTPKIDADPDNMRLFVRAKRTQIDQIKKIVSGLELGHTGGEVPSGDQMRIFPARGEQAEQLLEIASKFWRNTNPVIVYPAASPMDAPPTERVPGMEKPTSAPSESFPPSSSPASPESPSGEPPSSGDDPDQFADGTNLTAHQASRPAGARFLTMVSDNRTPAIRCQVTPRGLLLQSDDAEALDRFENHLRAISGPSAATPSPPIVFYLRHSKPDDALRMLAELLEGGEAAGQGGGGSLVNGYSSSGASGGFLSTFISSADGTMTMISGSTTVVADTRLNRLIAQGPTDDIELIENYLAIIDKDSSITDVRTYGTSRVIELEHTRASEVAAAVREAYAGRITASVSARGANPQGRGNERGEDPRDRRDDDDNRGGSGRRESEPDKKAAPKGGGAAKDLEPKMTVAVHEPSNSLIITAPDELFKDVEQLVRQIDSRNEQAVEVVVPVNGEVFGIMMEQLMSGESSTTRRTPPSSTRSRADRR